MDGKKILLIEYAQRLTNNKEKEKTHEQKRRDINIPNRRWIN